MKATLFDVAEAAGVSDATACRCLKGHPRQSAATTERIRAVAEQLGYSGDARRAKANA